MLSTLFRSLRRLTEKGRFRNEIEKQLQAFAEGELNDIESGIVLARAGVVEAVPALHMGLIRGNVFALCRSEDDFAPTPSIRQGTRDLWTDHIYAILHVPARTVRVSPRSLSP